MLRRGSVAQLLTVAACLLLCLGPAGATLAWAAGSSPAVDHVRMIKLMAQEATTTDSSDQVHFDAAVSYQLQSLPRGFLLLFLFKDNAGAATESAAGKEWVSAGTGQVHLTTTFQPDPGMHTWTLVAGLFQDDRTLLAWTETQPFTIGQWPGRAMFDRALADRQSGNYARAVDDLTAAIQIAPETGQYYCWRADSRVHLGQYGAAVDDYTRALGLIPNDRACQVGRGSALLWNGEQERAIGDFTAVIDQTRTPDRWTVLALKARGIAYADLGRYSDAIVSYQTYLSLVPNAPDRAVIEGWIGDLQSAESQGTTATGSS